MQLLWFFQNLDGKWYIYFAASDGNNTNHRMFALEGNSQDPQGSYTLKGKMFDSANDVWAIDGTVLATDSGVKYFVWSGWQGADDGFTQRLYIAPMSNPWTLSGSRSEISSPDYSWEKMGAEVNEGPAVLKRNGKINIIYSASGSYDSDYCLGQLTLTGGNILSKSSWTKKSTPVFSSSTNAYGPGHCSFTKSPDGSEDWIVYHATPQYGQHWDKRTTRIQKFTWNADNTPNFGTPLTYTTFQPEPSGSPAGGVRYEAENAFVNHAVVRDASGASSGKCVGYIDYSDSYIEFNVNVDTSAAYSLYVTYGNGSGTTGTHNLSINGTANAPVSYANTGCDKLYSQSKLRGQQ